MKIGKREVADTTVRVSRRRKKWLNQKAVRYDCSIGEIIERLAATGDPSKQLAHVGDGVSPARPKLDPSEHPRHKGAAVPRADRPSVS